MNQTSSPIFLLMLIGILAWFAIPATAGDFLIIPGQRVGSVALGQSRTSVHGLLHAPQLVRNLPGRIIEESWVSRLSPVQQHPYENDERYWKFFFVNIYFRQGQVVQIEINSPQFRTRSGLSTNSPAALFEKRYQPYHSSDLKSGFPLMYGTRDREGGFPGYKHYVRIEDASQVGLAWRYGSWGDLAPEPDPDVQEVIIVYRPGQRAILEPDAGNRFVLTMHDVEFVKKRFQIKR